MSKIKIFALGGLNEHGKNMYVVDVDNDLFVFDSGLKYADDDTLGIDYVIPNYDYLKENEERIKGIFITHGHDEQMGAIPDMLEDLKKVKVYGTKYTLKALRLELADVNLSDENLIEIKAHHRIDFGKCSIFPISLSHSIPDNVGYVLNTPDGAIFYTGNFIFDPTMLESYHTDIGKIAYVGKQGVLCLMCESLYASRSGYTSPKHRMKPLLRESIVNSKGRVICNMFSNQIYRMQELFDVITDTKYNVVIMGKRMETFISESIDEGYIKFDKSRILSLRHINEDNVIVMICDEREKAYSSLNRIVRGYDKFTSLKTTDTIIFLSPVYETNEKAAAKLFDRLARSGVNLVIPGKEYLDLHASSEDVMMMINLMNPKYFMPIIGEYRHQIDAKEAALSAGIKEENIIVKLNGQVSEFENGNLVDTNEVVHAGEISIDGKMSGDIGELVIKDREALSDNGVLVVIATLSKLTKDLVAGPEVITKGYMYPKDSNIIDNAIEISKKVILDNNGANYVQFNKVKNEIRDKLGSYLYKETNSRPMILVVIQEV